MRKSKSAVAKAAVPGTDTAEGEVQLQLIPVADPKVGTKIASEYYSVDEIEPLTQVRSDAAESVKNDPAFVESIRLDGVLEDIEIRPHPDPERVAAGKLYAIVFGERRWRACKLVGRTVIPAKIKTGESVDDELRRLLRQAGENHHQRLPKLDEARFYKRLMDLTKGTVASVAKIVGQPKSTVSDRLAIVEAPAPFQELFLHGALTAAAAPVVKKYADVPPQLLEKAVDVASKSWQWRQSIDAGRAISLGSVDAALKDVLFGRVEWKNNKHERGGGLLEFIPDALALAYQGERVRIGDAEYATDKKQLIKLRTKHDEEQAAKAAAAAKKKGKSSSTSPKQTAAQKKAAEKERKQRAADQAKAELENARWLGAKDGILLAVVDRIKTAPIGSLVDRVLEIGRDGEISLRREDEKLAEKYLKPGRTGDTCLRYIVLCDFLADIEDLEEGAYNTEWARKRVLDYCKALGIEAQAKKLLAAAEAAHKAKLKAAAATADESIADAKARTKAAKKKGSK